MRSRYSAYSMADMDYIKATMRGKALLGFDLEQSRQWALSVVWVGLEVLNSRQENETLGFVEFIARFMEGNKLKAIHEISEFHYQQGKWFYVDGCHQTSPKSKTRTVSRNEPCPCGSQKKFKNCHAR